MLDSPETTDKKRLMTEVLIKLNDIHREVKRITGNSYQKPF